MSELVSAMSKFAAQIADIFVKEYSECETIFHNGIRLSDGEVWEYIKQHTTWWGRLNPHYVSDCALYSHMMFATEEKGPCENWIFDFSKKTIEQMDGPFRRI